MADDPWAKFRTPAPSPSPAEGGGTASITPADPWAKFRAPAAAAAPADKPAAAPRYDAAGDVGGGIVTGLVNGVTGLIGIPGLIQQADGYLGGKALDALGFTNAAEKVRNAPFLPTPESLTGHVEKVTGPLHQPETLPGQYARTAAEFAPGALIGPGGVVRKVAETVVPSVLSETAGQATKGTAAEPYARLMGAIFGNVGTAAVAARADAPARAIGTAAGRVTPEQFDRAEALAETGRRVGIPLTGPEAVQHVTNNGTKLADVQRFVEGSPQSAVLAEMMAARPGQMQAATGRTLDTIAPQSAEPSTLGPLAADAAYRSIANSPEGQALAERVWQVGPRTTPAQAGPAIQDGLHDVYQGREGIRAALAERDYAAAREAPEGIGIERTVSVERPGDPIVTYPKFDRPQFTDAAPRPLEGITKADPANGGAGPESLARFIARNGGLDLTGDLRSQDFHRFNIPGAGNVAREGGKPLDSFWRVKLMEAGYLKPDADGGMARDIRAELMRKLGNERRGVPSYPIGAEPVAAGRSVNGRMADEHATAVSLADSRFQEDLGRAGIDYATVHPDIRSRVVGALVRGEHTDPLEAYERTVGAMQGPLQPYSKSTTVREEIPDVRFGQANPSAVVDHIDDALRTAKGPVAKALTAARGTLWTRAGPGQSRELDLSVEGLQGARAAIGDLISGAEPTAQRALIGVRDRLDQALAAVPEHAEATRNFAAASVPLRPFENQALAKVIERDEFGRQFTLPPERSAPTIEAAGPAAVRTFNAVAPPEARAGFENYLGTKLLDAATDARGTVSGDALALGIRDRADVLDTVPGLQGRLQRVRAADEALAPQRRGAIGELSRAATTEAAAGMVLPSKPRVGGELELVDLIMRTAREEPQGTAQLVRQRLADQADTSMGRLVGGEAQGGGAKFAKDIAGTEQQATNLDAVLRALPDSPAAPAAVDDLMQILRATGTRKPQGSPTDFNAQYRAEIGGETLLQQALMALRTQGRTLLTNAGDASRRAYLGRNNATLADILSAPDSVQQIRAIAGRRSETPFADAFMRTAVQAPAAARAR